MILIETGDPDPDNPHVVTAIFYLFIWPFLSYVVVHTFPIYADVCCNYRLFGFLNNLLFIFSINGFVENKSKKYQNKVKILISV